MNRPDTGTQRNTIVELAAAIMTSKADQMKSVADQLFEKGDIEASCHWSGKAQEIYDAVSVMDEHAGCWS